MLSHCLLHDVAPQILIILHVKPSHQLMEDIALRHTSSNYVNALAVSVRESDIFVTGYCCSLTSVVKASSIIVVSSFGTWFSFLC